MPAEAIICAKLQNKKTRQNLPSRGGKPYYEYSIPPMVKFGYRSNEHEPGAWVYKVRREVGGKIVETVKTLGIADDREPADGRRVRSFLQAVADVELLVYGPKPEDVKTGTVRQALEAYKSYLTGVEANPYNAERPLKHLTKEILDKPCALVTAKELEDFRTKVLRVGQKGGMSGASYNRLKSSLITAIKREAKECYATFVSGLPGMGQVLARNVVLEPGKVLEFVAASYALDTHLGYFMDTFARTGNRPCQLARLLVDDFEDGPKPRLFMYKSRKAGGAADKRHDKGQLQFWVAIPPELAARLREAAKGRPKTARLLVRANGRPWDADCKAGPAQHYRLKVMKVVEAIGLDPTEVTAYALRHSNIVRMLNQGVPIRLVAAQHDTSVPMIERHYSKHITNHADEILRKALLTGTVDLSVMLGHNGGGGYIADAA